MQFGPSDLCSDLRATWTYADLVSRLQLSA